MKTLYLVRHAKSSWKNPELDDFDRPLNARGERDAPFMGQLLEQKHKIPDLILSSPAKRAKTTAKEIAKKINYEQELIQYDSGLYHAHEEQILQIIQKQSNDFQKLMVVGHNPGLTYFANHLTEENIENIPTSGIFEVQFDVEKWQYVAPFNAQFVVFEFPKKYL